MDRECKGDACSMYGSMCACTHVGSMPLYQQQCYLNKIQKESNTATSHEQEQ